MTTIKERLGYLPKIERTSEIGLPSQKMLYYTIAPQDPYSTPTDQLGHLGHISEKHVLKQHELRFRNKPLVKQYRNAVLLLPGPD